DCAERRNAEEQGVGVLRRQQFETVGREANLRNEVSRRKETIGRISAQIERLQREETEAGDQASALQQQLTAAQDQYSGQQIGFAELKKQLAEAEEALARN